MKSSSGLKEGFTSFQKGLQRDMKSTFSVSAGGESMIWNLKASSLELSASLKSCTREEGDL
jgi:hypothetical protein